MRGKVGLFLMGGGAIVLVWVGLTLWRGDPLTALYTRYEQRQLSARLSKTENLWRPRRVLAQRPGLRSLAREAAAYDASLHDGDPVGWITIPRIGLHMVVVQGTSTGDLARGPGHYDASSGKNTRLPGMGGVVAIAGHRTTFLAPFRHLDAVHPGDLIRLTMPYGTFTYRMFAQQTVLPNDWSILRPRGFENVVLSACTPVYSASHRLIVYGRLVAVAGAAGKTSDRA